MSLFVLRWRFRWQDKDISRPSLEELIISKKNILGEVREQFKLRYVDKIFFPESWSDFTGPYDTPLQIRIFIVGHCIIGFQRDGSTKLKVISHFCVWKTMEREILEF